MKRLKITLLACSIGMALLLAGCGDGGNGGLRDPRRWRSRTPHPPHSHRTPGDNS
ncbi:MAG: hypothetical protein Ct9H300mP1_06950 [Planctomycetaceae bacterium]|nr:MAG: hypothetical protein Ct9H300mP1_06950 [Planctomycetaceae bacterium]